jgi:hypothetical protein
MTTPVRLQLSRKKGFSLQALSIATNGLLAVNVTRQGTDGGVWGNWAAWRASILKGEDAVSIFRRWVAEEASATWRQRAVRDLRGKNLACACKPGEPCHADVLLELANRQQVPSPLVGEGGPKGRVRGEGIPPETGS